MLIVNSEGPRSELVNNLTPSSAKPPLAHDRSQAEGFVVCLLSNFVLKNAQVLYIT